MKAYFSIPCVFAESKHRKEKVVTQYVSTGDLIRANLLKQINSPLLHTISESEPEDVVPTTFSRIFDPFAQVITEDKQHQVFDDWGVALPPTRLLMLIVEFL